VAGPGRTEAAQERRRGEMGPSSKTNSFRISIDFRIWQNLENCTRRFRKKFDMGIFPKIF
jgi:hypothetical protein